MNQDTLYRNRRKIIIGFWVFMALIIVWAIADHISHIGKIPVVISAVPGDAKIMIGDKRYSEGTQWIVPGDYKMAASKDGFADIKRNVTVTDQKKQNVLAVSLVPKSDEAKRWAAEHNDEYKDNEQFGAIEAAMNGDYFSKLHPITTKLPYTDPYYKIGYVRHDDRTISLTIDTPSPRYRFYAIEKIRNLGFEPTDFTITFTDFKNPLEAK